MSIEFESIIHLQTLRRQVANLLQQNGWVMGKMRNWKTVRVRTKDRNQLEGELVEARIVEAKAWVLEGKQADIFDIYK